MSERSPGARYVALGVAFAGINAGAAVGRAALVPGRAALRAPVLGHVLRRAGDDLAADGRRAQVWANTRVDELLIEHRIVERVAAQIVAATDVDRVVAAVLDDPRTEQAVERALESAGLERLVVRVLDSRFLDELTERVLQSPEMDRVVEYVAASPQLVEAVSRHTQTLAEEMVADVRRRSQSVDDVAERAVRGWLRRPRPSPA